ncbi:MAG TPA: hypothetical protein VM238_12845 [Phycisphaerae bacterium]|nr:hypothetical protein [Phycisphaerae bacterium]
MPSELGRVTPTRKNGGERFRNAEDPLPFEVLSFWQWSTSDLLSNVTRGSLAEYIVARAVDATPNGVRDEWATFDLLTSDGIKVEVKSAAYVQSWHQTKLSTVCFRTPKTRAWDPETNAQSKGATRHADVYVFALLAHKDKQTVDPLDVSQWQFYVLPTSVLDERTRSQQSITLPTLQRLAGKGVPYLALAKAVRTAAGREERDCRTSASS